MTVVGVEKTSTSTRSGHMLAKYMPVVGTIYDKTYALNEDRNVKKLSSLCEPMHIAAYGKCLRD